MSRCRGSIRYCDSGPRKGTLLPRDFAVPPRRPRHVYIFSIETISRPIDINQRDCRRRRFGPPRADPRTLSARTNREPGDRRRGRTAERRVCYRTRQPS